MHDPTQCTLLTQEKTLCVDKTLLAFHLLHVRWYIFQSDWRRRYGITTITDSSKPVHGSNRRENIGVGGTTTENAGEIHGRQVCAMATRGGWTRATSQFPTPINSVHNGGEWREDLISGCPEIERKTFEANGYPPSLLSRELIKKSPSQHKETQMTKKTSAKKWFTSHMFNNFLLFL